ncbi:MAG: hypothetical protein R2813_13660 [Flavobacteriales bacterium]
MGSQPEHSLNHNHLKPSIMNTFLTILATATGVVLLILSIFKWNILRDDPAPSPTPEPPNPNPEPPNQKPPFSLSRVQMMWWLAIIYASFVIIMSKLGWRIDEGTIVFSNTALIILGIGTGTTAMSQAVDSAQKGKALKLKPEASKSLFSDVASNSNGLAITRLQQILFSLVFGIIFLAECILRAKNIMPDFDDSWLALIGISAGGYVVSKGAGGL